MMSIRRLYDEHKEVIARTKIEKRGVGRPSWVRQKKLYLGEVHVWPKLYMETINQ